MYPQSSDSEVASMQGNIPSMMLMYSMYTTTFGNYSFVVTPPQAGQIADQFPSYGYFSLEAALYASTASNPAISPTNVMTGGTTGTQQLIGAQVQNDGTGTGRVLNGYQASNQQLL
jgi:hypothetical protein